MNNRHPKTHAKENQEKTTIGAAPHLDAKPLLLYRKRKVVRPKADEPTESSTHKHEVVDYLLQFGAAN